MRTRRLVACLLLSACGCVRPPAGPPDLDFPVGDFALTERSGRPVTAADLSGKVWVASFVFTRCTGPCPQVTAAVARLQSEITDPGVRFVTFTVDPGRDDPDELKRYAAHFRADPERWLFLTGPEEQIHALLRERFKVGVSRAPGTPPPGQEFDHSTRLAVVDKRGVIRAYFDGAASGDGPDAAFEDNLRRLRETVARLLRE